MVLCVAAFTTVVFQAIRQPVVVGYLIAGVIVGPHTPIRLRQPGAHPHHFGTRRNPADVRARAGIFGTPAGPSRSHLRLHFRTAGQPDGVARLYGRAGDGMDQPRKHLHRRAAVDFEHHHRREGVRREQGAGASARTGSRRAADRGSDRGDRTRGADGAGIRATACRRG